MLMGVFEIKDDARQLGERWLLICDLVGGMIGAVIAVVVLVALLG
jgi:hypothetical protein